MLFNRVSKLGSIPLFSRRTPPVKEHPSQQALAISQSFPGSGLQELEAGHRLAGEELRLAEAGTLEEHLAEADILEVDAHLVEVGSLEVGIQPVEEDSREEDVHPVEDSPVVDNLEADSQEVDTPPSAVASFEGTSCPSQGQHQHPSYRQRSLHFEPYLSWHERPDIADRPQVLASPKLPF